jgi:hypothetical protein
MTHWSRLSSEGHTSGALWITAHHDSTRHGIVHASSISRLFFPDGNSSKYNVPMLIDISQTRSVFWPLVRALASASPEYMEQLADPPDMLALINGISPAVSQARPRYQYGRIIMMRGRV